MTMAIHRARLKTGGVGTARPAAVRGFTLIEILVVMVIMSLLVVLVSVMIRPGDREVLHVEAERLAQLLDLAGTESRLTGKPIAWTADGGTYRFWRFRDGRWSEIREGDLLRMRTLPPGMSISDFLVESTQRRGGMRLEFGPDRPTLAFTIELSLGTERHAISGSPVGEVRVLSGGGEAYGTVALR